MTKIVHSEDPITLIGAGPAKRADLDLALTMAPQVVAVDGGAQLALAAGVTPLAVTGDFDSLPEAVMAQLDPARLRPTPDQNYTDFDKALRLCAAPVCIGVGFSGGRLDHHLAALHALVTRCDHPCVLLGEEEITFLAPPRLALPCQADDVVSLFPMGVVQGRSEGLHWPLQGHQFAPDRFVGTSNRATGPVVIEVDQPCMLVILPRRMLGAVTQALASLPRPARWPARAE